MKSSAQWWSSEAASSAPACCTTSPKAGWTDVVLLERKQLTAGSTWHAAGGMHTLNGDPNVARLQQYTVNLYREIEAESGQNCSIHLPGGLMLADTPERLDWLRMAQARGRYLGMHMDIISVAEAKELNPLLEEKYFVGVARPRRRQRRPIRRHPRLRDLRPQPRRRGLHRHVGHRSAAARPTARGT